MISLRSLTTHNIKCRYYNVYWTFCRKRAQIVHKVFNGYFLFVVKPQKLRDDNQHITGPNISMQNINPADTLRYKYDAIIEPQDISVKMTIIQPIYRNTPAENLTTIYQPMIRWHRCIQFFRSELYNARTHVSYTNFFMIYTYLLHIFVHNIINI